MSENIQPVHGVPDDTLFARLLGETAVSDSRFARQVNERSKQARRTNLGLARTTVGHWRRGMRPRDPMVAELAAAEVSAMVGYPVTPSDLGWRGESHTGDDLGLTVADEPIDTLRNLAGLSGRDMRRRDIMLEGSVFVATAFADPALRALTGGIDRLTDAGHTPPPTGSMIRDMTETFRKLDARYGSGEIRSQVIGFLHDRTRSVLDGRHTPDMFSALAELTQFGGWLAQDSGHQAIAQRYYVQALALAEHANDAMMAGRVLAGMSDQAAHLGHPRQSLSLARAAIERIAKRATPAVTAMLYDKEAWALARAGDEKGCLGALEQVESSIGHAGGGEDPTWAAFYNEADVAECRGHCLLLLEQPRRAAGELLEARVRQTPSRTRTRSYAEADLAIAYLHRPDVDLEAALDAGGRALTLAGQVESGRVADKLRELDRKLAEHDNVVAIREWRAKAAPVLRRSAAIPA